MTAAFNIPYGISQLPAGWLADHIGPRLLIAIGICGVALAGFLVGFSQTYILMIVFLGLMGVLGGGYHPASPPVISALVEPKNRGRALGVHLIGGSASFFLTPLIGIAIATAWGWRGSFITLAVPTMAFGIVFYVLMGRRAATKRVEHRITNSHNKAPPTSGRLRRLTAFIILSTFAGAVTFSIIAFVPLLMVDHFSVSKETAAAFISLIYSAGLWASPLGGYLSDRLGRVPVVLAVCLITGPVLYLLSLAPYGLGIGALLLTIGMIQYIRMPVSEAYIIGQTSEYNRSTILGIYYFGNLEGTGLLTPVIGYLIDQFGFSTSFTIVAAITVTVTLACSILLWGKRD